MRRILLTLPFFAGELPKELGNLIKLKSFNVDNNKIGGELHVPAYIRCVLADMFLAGELPKELGNLVKLTHLWLYNNEFRGESYVPAYIRSLVT